MKTRIFYLSKIIKNLEEVLASDIIIDRDAMGRIMNVWNNDRGTPISEAIQIEKNRYYSQELEGGTSTIQRGRLAGTEWVALSNEETPNFTVEDHIIYTPNTKSICIYNLNTNVTKRFSTNRRKVGIYHRQDKYHVVVVE